MHVNRLKPRPVGFELAISHQNEKNGAKWRATMKRRVGEFYRNYKHEGRNVGLITKQAMTRKEH